MSLSYPLSSLMHVRCGSYSPGNLQSGGNSPGSLRLSKMRAYELRGAENHQTASQPDSQYDPRIKMEGHNK